MSEEVFLVLQGGGALGAYQAGVYQALEEQGYEPDWLAGISIGAINSAIIAGNPPERRLARLRAFWDMISDLIPYDGLRPVGPARRIFNEISAATTATLGATGFFRPHVLPPPLSPPGSQDAISFYDTTPLRESLLELVDFELLNTGPTRLSIGAVNVLTGNFTYFDSEGMELGPEHIMASGALPPGFPPVMIDGQPYWDGGLVSNTPLQYVLDNKRSCDAIAFQVDLFNARGDMPLTLPDVIQREKDIRYSSRTRLNTEMERALLELRGAAARLLEKLPPEMRDDPDAQFLSGYQEDGAVTVMHLINKSEIFETQSKDYEFSRLSVNQHWGDGYRDASTSLAHQLWKTRDRECRGVVTYDLLGGEGRVRGGYHPPG